MDKNEYSVPKGITRISIEEKQIVQSRIKRNFHRIIELRKICKIYKPEAIISFMGEPNFRSMIATIGLPLKRIVSVRNDPVKEYPGKLGIIVGKFILPFADGCVFQTEDAKKWFPERLQKKSKIILNEVAEQFFETQYVGGNAIVTLGRLCKQKNHKLLINAFSKIEKDFPEHKLLIYGVGDKKSELDKLIGELHIENRVELKGLTNNSAEVLSKAEIFVLSSDYEGMPNALMEALAVGVPSISTDCPCGGPRTLIKNNENGILVPVGKCEELSQAMRKLLINKDDALQMGLKAKEKAKKFSPDKIFDVWQDYIESIIE